MTEPTSMLSAVRLGWQLLSRIPWFSRWLLRRAFPVSLCKDMLIVEISGPQSRFELLSVRANNTLACLELRIYNPLPFCIQLDASRLQVSIDSSNLLDAMLNTKLAVPAAGFGRLTLPEFSLTEQQTNWVKNLSREYTRVRTTLYWSCISVVHNWETSGLSEFPVLVRSDANEDRAGAHV